MQEQKAGQLGGDGSPGSEALWPPRDKASALPLALGHDGAASELGSKLLTAGFPQGAPWQLDVPSNLSLPCRRRVQAGWQDTSRLRL